MNTKVVMKTLEEITNELKKEIPYKWRIQSTNKAGTKASCVAYIDARDVMDRLDEVMTIACWKDSYRRDSKDRLICTLELKIDGEWIEKEDIGTESKSEGEKGEFSDAFKRSAVKWGIGRFLYDLEIKWLDIVMVKDKRKYYYNGEQVNPYKLEKIFNTK